MSDKDLSTDLNSKGNLKALLKIVLSLKVIILVGLPLSGKSSHARKLGDLENIPLVETGTFVYKAVEERGLEATVENIVKVAGECKKESDSYFTERAIEFIEKNYKSEPVVFLSGIKARSEYELVKEKVGETNVFLISFHASADTRHGRLTNVDRQEASKEQGESKATEDLAMARDRSRFDLRDSKELGYGLGELMALADFVVNTEDRVWPFNTTEKTIKVFKMVIDDIKM